MGDNMTATQQTKSYTEPTFEEISLNMRIAMELNSAIAADDDMQVDQLMRNISMPASVLDTLKMGMGASWVEAKGLGLSHAEATLDHGRSNQ
jgi:hypothetical protein